MERTRENSQRKSSRRAQNLWVSSTEDTEKNLSVPSVSLWFNRFFYFTFAQASFNVTVRLKTSVSSVESGSTEK